jgi:hypothetical protein
MDDEAPLDDGEEDDPCIPLNAITCISSTVLIQLGVRIANKTIGALVDSGSTYSFISTSMTHRLLLQPLPRPGLQVLIANGDYVSSADIYHVVHIFIHMEKFVIDLFVIPFDGYDMVIGVQWLRTLGLILLDFEHARMSCWCGNHHVVW